MYSLTEDSVNSPFGFKTWLTCTVSFRRIILASRAVALQLFIDSVKRRQESLLAFLTAFLKINWACLKASQLFPSFDLMALRRALRASLRRQVSCVFHQMLSVLRRISLMEYLMTVFLYHLLTIC